MKLALLALFASASAFAGDASEFRNLGFSADGKYFAFAQVGVRDGNNQAYAEVAVVDVARNIFVASRHREEADRGDENPGNIEQVLTQAIRAVNLPRFQIRQGRNLGEDLLVRVPTDFSSYQRNLFSLDYTAEGGAGPTLPKYEILVEERDAPANEDNESCRADNEPYGSKLLRLSLVGPVGPDQQTVVMQDDQTLPRSRACAANYNLRRVILAPRGRGLVSVLNYIRPGYEGPDYRFVVVTGTPSLLGIR